MAQFAITEGRKVVAVTEEEAVEKVGQSYHPISRKKMEELIRDGVRVATELLPMIDVLAYEGVKYIIGGRAVILRR